MELELLENSTDEAWDKEIAGYETKFIFHHAAWLNFLEESQSGHVLKYRIVDRGNTLGYFCGVLIRKGPFKILGSPLKGWTTNYMGPIVNSGFDVEKFLYALDAACRALGIHHVELCNPVFDPGMMRSHGFDVYEAITYIVPLSSNEEQMWKRMDRMKCRQAINRAERKGLIAEEPNDPGFIHEFYNELQEVFAKQGLVPTYGVDRVQCLMKHLSPDQVITVQVRHEDKVIATGIFPHDEKKAVGFGAASWRAYQKLNPNELLWWSVMQQAASRGLQYLDMSGKGSFKPKFGGTVIPVYEFSKSYSPFAKAGRQLYKSFFYAKQRVKGRSAQRRMRTAAAANGADRVGLISCAE